MRKFQQYITEGVYDPAIFKAFFLAGGPGSGKSWVSARALSGMGLKVINSDNAFTNMLNKEKMSLKFADHTPAEIEKRDKIRDKSKQVAGMQLAMALQGRLGLIIDSTARDVEKIQSEAKRLRELGYDIHMVFVNTSLDVALERNANRNRSVPENIVKTNWNIVQSNMGKFQSLFQAKNFFIIDNSSSEKELVTTTLNRCASIVRRTMNQPHGFVAQQCITRQLRIKDRT